ncbi:acyltransferase family protein [Cetobacterium sp.]|uniref:acyltransferase family protein n=1 Tax=Cetobacterium sp. TaxID=2071632 RepID=UPI002FCC5CC9
MHLKDDYLTKNKSKVLKFIGVLLMINLHLFAFPERIKPYTYKSLFLLKEIPIEYFLAKGSGIAAQIFLFMSGYGMYIQGKMDYKSMLIRIKNIYLEYWLIFIVFIPLGYYLKVYKFEEKEFFLNFFALKTTYNGEWWFLKVYILQILMYPILVYCIDKKSKLMLGIGVLLTFLGMILNKLCQLKGIENIGLSVITNTLICYYPFICGIYVAKNKIFTKFSKLKINNKICLFLVIGLIIIIQNIKYINYIANLFLVPLFIYLLGGLNVEKSKLFLKLSKYTTGIWLVHSFFCYYYFKEIIFMPKYSILIFIWNIVLSIMVVEIINRIKKYLQFIKLNTPIILIKKCYQQK